VVDHMAQYGGKLGYTQVTWRNLYMDPIFATFIARLFQDSFRSGIVKQDFRLTSDRSKLNLIKIIDRFVGRGKFNELLLDGRLDIFNSSSFCSNLLTRFFNSWLDSVKSIKARKVPLFLRTYKNIFTRIKKRRTNVDHFASDKELNNKYPLTPYKLTVEESHINTFNHLSKKYKVIDSLHIQASARSAISTHELYTQYYQNPRSQQLYPIKGVRWDTLSPRGGRT
jgi:hypothetical protein